MFCDLQELHKLLYLEKNYLVEYSINFMNTKALRIS